MFSGWRRRGAQGVPAGKGVWPRRMLVFLIGLGCGTGVCTPFSPGTQSAASRPNVVLILGDYMGYGDIGPYGAPDIDTPHLDRMAREGVKLTQFYAAAPICTPARIALLTGPADLGKDPGPMAQGCRLLHGDGGKVASGV